MEGVTILNETVISASPTWLIVLGIIVTCVSFIGATIVSLNYESGWVLLFAVVCVLSLVFTIRIGTVKEHIEYDVLIDEHVLFEEFNEKYEVIEQRGIVYTIKEKKQ